MSEPTVRRGKREIEQVVQGTTLKGRTRVPGGGRKPLTETDPELLGALERLVDPVTRGDPESPLKWTSKSTRTLAGELVSQGRQVSYRSIGPLLRSLGYRLQSVRKAREGHQYPDRDAQFRYLAQSAQAFTAAGDPVVSVDTKKKLRHEVARRERARRLEGPAYAGCVAPGPCSMAWPRP